MRLFDKLVIYFITFVAINSVITAAYAQNIPSRSIASSFGKKCHVLIKRFIPAKQIELLKSVPELVTKFDSAVELELKLSNEVMNLLTTTDGTLSPLFKTDTPSENVIQKVMNITTPGHRIKSLSEIKWEKLDLAQKRRVINLATEYLGRNFSENRSIIGLRVRPVIDLFFDEETTFLGNKYSVGWHKINMEKILGKVEYMGSIDVERRSIIGVELHFRSNMVSAGQLSNDAWKFLDAANIERIHQHVHVVNSLPIKELQSSPVLEVTKMTDFFRRANLAIELLFIGQGGSLRRISHNGITYFDSLNSSALRSLVDYFANVSQNVFNELKTSVKHAYIGMRGHDVYDQPDIWGLEFRKIPAYSSPKDNRQLLDAIQSKMTSNNYGVSEERLGNWLETVAKKTDLNKLPDTLSNLLWYEKTSSELALKIPDVLVKTYKVDQAYFKSTEALKIMQIFDNDFKGVKILFHPWHLDPLYFDNPKASQKLLEAQAKALNALKKEVFPLISRRLSGDKELPSLEINAVLRDFIVTSGLIKAVVHSILE